MAIVSKPGENSYYKPKASIIAEMGSRTNPVNHAPCANSLGPNLQPNSSQSDDYTASDENNASSHLLATSAREGKCPRQP